MIITISPTERSIKISFRYKEFHLCVALDGCGTRLYPAKQDRSSCQSATELFSLLLQRIFEAGLSCVTFCVKFRFNYDLTDCLEGLLWTMKSPRFFIIILPVYCINEFSNSNQYCHFLERIVKTLKVDMFWFNFFLWCKFFSLLFCFLVHFLIVETSKNNLVHNSYPPQNPLT